MAAHGLPADLRPRSVSHQAVVALAWGFPAVGVRCCGVAVAELLLLLLLLTMLQKLARKQLPVLILLPLGADG